MGEEKQKFRFLSDEEFGALSAQDKVAYLSAASAEIDAHQKRLREQVIRLVKEQAQAGKR